MHLVGLCQGGWLSGMFAARFPGKVASLVLAGESDDITTREQVFNTEQLVGTPKHQIVKKLAPGGHIGLFMGSHTLRDTWPKIGAWIKRHQPADK